ncbi:SbcC/MukB-like Walker B domain-containing protein [Caballeronia sp. LZ034LL]|uniref:ATP-binding protein n=1 Tax=Caballeronia sp. LZ034LL TaxID=3038567 RepID=UPI002862C02D|nr:SbcC/MukB-like Walker B domain-containing protein [Caballeronia sp. LZ034LL]MDR5839199.1 SbcC/MukB-like Walker B domain-containing protein [Caballeronia sp. LZ034LL]
MNTAGQALLLDGGNEQFRLTRIQIFNWGTFCNVFDFSIPAQGYLFVGPSGSGKSTVLDAHAALMTPPKWIDFNVAAREAERHGRDRNVMTYLRGAWAQQTGDSGEYVSQYLRNGTTWSAIAETYRNEQGRVVVLAQVLWVKGNSTAPGDAKRVFLTLEREFHIQELEFFAKHEFDVRRFKHDLVDAKVHPEFSAYQERFRRLLGIDNERALRLLHKTQSAKNLGDLNAFLRDFMLDEPETFSIAASLVTEFGELNEAHQEVVAARKQIQTLKPARDEHMALDRDNNERNGLQAIQAVIDPYREHRRRLLMEERIAELEVEKEGTRQEGLLLARRVDDEFIKLTDLQRQKINMDAGVLVRLEDEIKAAEVEKPVRIAKRDQAAAACKVMGWAMPDGVVGFVQRVDSARQRVLKARDLKKEVDDRKDQLKTQHRMASEEFSKAVAEIQALERQKSNLPARLVDLRERMTCDLSIPEEKLPFVGELVEVRPDAAEWRGAIERVLGGFARSILVDEKHYSVVSAYLNERNIGERLVYFRIIPQPPGRPLSANSMVRKLNLASGIFGDWVREELKHSFDLECADTLQALRHAHRAVTREGQVKHNAMRHEKNDRHSFNDRSQWVLGFDNKDKLNLYKEKASELGRRISELQAALDKIGEEEEFQQKQLLHCQNLSNLTWSDVDVGSLLTRIDDLTERLKLERDARPDLAILDDRIKAQEGVHATAVSKRNEEDAKGKGIARDIDQLNSKLADLTRLWPTIDKPPAFADEISVRYAATGKALTLENVDQVTGLVDRGLSGELRALDTRLTELKNSIVQRFAEFNRLWPAVAAGLDATLASADDYLAKLKRLEDDNLPAYEDRFFSLLREQSDQNLTLLVTKLDEERSAIRARMELVNESLRTAPFNPGTHLVIDTTDKSLEDIRLFRASLRESLSHSFSNDRDLAEERFKELAALVKRLASQETVDKNWRSLVLDVRQHVEFVARELDEDEIEVEVYRSGAGKSGGQRQKLAATCLAAALRYQLGGQDRALPGYSTVVLDEAFDKADAEFTAMAMNIFKTFGFQMIVATPLKSVMTLEPFIGGACFVHIKDRKTSAVIPIEYDDETQRLKLSPDVRHAEEASIS